MFFSAIAAEDEDGYEKQMTKYQLRRWWFQVHKWIGITLAVLIIPLSLSGAALVWHDALDGAINPQRYRTTGSTLRTPGAYVAAARARLGPGERLAMLTLPEHGGPVTVAAAPARAPDRPGPPQRTMIYLDPPTARVLDVASSAAGLVRFVHVLHGSLQIPGGWGRMLVGWLGVAMLVSSVSGLWLWWPSVGRWTRGFRWRRRPDTNSNLHHLLGFWISLPLFVLSLTGAWIAFPTFFGALVGQGNPRGPDRMMQARAAPVAAARLPVDVAVARATALAHGKVRSITWPTEKKPDWAVQVGPRSVSVADDDGVAALAPERAGQGGVARLMRRLHSGEGMGPVWQTIVFIGGILPAVLAVTGVIMWWRTRARSGAKPRLSAVAERAPAGGL
ncbi:PepSY-associated TM helix domain-containing protein [uncultured Sphingomonas sp.]|uniref:PepSY-associated TM helix domain-containing protein n=1 Tax=uncultured Sphingomonas sp. TaxID=158754 RepID=UPI0035C994DC